MICLYLKLKFTESSLSHNIIKKTLNIKTRISHFHPFHVDFMHTLRTLHYQQQTENLYQEIEQHFYLKHEKVEPCLKRAGVHDLSALLKRWLRELPQPILANDLVHLFYQTHGESHIRKMIQIPNHVCKSRELPQQLLMIFLFFPSFCSASPALPAQDQIRAISMLCLLLPHENRNTMRELLNFFKLVVELQSFNKMSIHNVATITGRFTTFFNIYFIDFILAFSPI